MAITAQLNTIPKRYDHNLIANHLRYQRKACLFRNLF